ncbi:pyroglutamyl-peptidase I [[Pseudomonas] carboxydohydrogena]|uniref:Pyrrolidone-carboxylate peptidase n=1 Tax=Afipia carboxydohydrogena TaxID=290 RepID=A0ABY8BL07_AFICR|nr:pyroglutamyl-peptidase I [[Pseudomonas] carboxydohydrogena]WEF50583.1 pyroglutamyl-peptidase I [[Pseudomonas] carboxydohydrogena]
MTAGRIRALITGFGPFPGAPYNPTAKLVERLVRLPRPAFANVERIGHVFPVSYRSVDAQLPALFARHEPDLLLMFGLATRTPYVRIETRARNTVTQLWPDADHATVLSRSIDPAAPATRRFGGHTQHLLHAAKTTGIDVRPSINAGAYLCNYLSWRAIEAVDQHPKARPLAAFIHVPKVPRDARSGKPGEITFEQLVDAGEAMLATLIQRARAARSRSNLTNGGS